MIRTRTTRRLLAVLTAALVTFTLSACDPTPVMLSGTVTFDDSGSPAGGTVVSVLTTGGMRVASQTTGVEGTFRFHESVLPAGEYLIAFGTQLTEFWEDTTDDGTPTTVAVSADQPAVIAASIAPSGIRGTVTADGSPVAGASVTVRPDDQDRVVATAMTGPDGTFELEVGDGTFMLTVEAAGQQTRFRKVVVFPYGNPVIDFTLDPEVPLTGVLYDGGPVHPATIVAKHGISNAFASTETRSDGSFTIGGLGTEPVELTVIRGTSRIDLPGTYSGDVGPIVLSESTCTHPDASAHVDLSGQDLSGADLRGCDLNHANLTGTDLTGAILSFAGLNSATLVSANLTGATLLGANLTGANLFGATLQDTDLRQATLTGSSSGGITGTPAVLPDRWALVQGALVGPGVRLPWAVFAGSDLSGLDFTDADLTSADLRGADLAGTQLTRANLTGADLTGADLTGADLTGSNLTGANLTDADLTDVRSRAITGTPTLPPAWSLIVGHLVGPGADLAGANLTNQTFNFMDLRGVNLRGANIGGAWLHRTNLFGADLSGATVSDVNLSYANLVEANLDEAVLSRSNLSGANLVNATSVGADYTGADLSGAWFHGVDLTGAVLDDTTITDTWLGGATLTLGADGVVGVPAKLPSGWSLVGGSLVQTP